jgi:ATP-dependent Lon protease
MDPDNRSLFEMRADAAASPQPRGPMDDMPADAMIIVPVRNVVLFPGLVAPLAVNRPESIAAVQEAVRAERRIGLLLQRHPEADSPGERDLYTVGTSATILRYVTGQDGAHQLVVHGDQRFRVAGFYDEKLPFKVARVELLSDPVEVTKDIEARMLQVKARAAEMLELAPRVPQELVAAIEQVNAPGALADFIAGLLDIKPAEKQDLLESVDLVERLDAVLRHMRARIEVLRLSKEIGDQTQGRLEGRQREVLLREQLRTIQ